jgi:chromosome segregation ATPase
MPTKKKTPSPARKPARKTRKPDPPTGGSVSAMASAQFKQLRKTVEQLTARLEKEANARAAASTVIAEAKKAREMLAGQMKNLRDEGSRLTKELKRALGDADKREAARRQAVDKIAELRKELAHRTEELKRKSEELAKLAVDSAGRAKDIIMSEGETPASMESPASEPPTVETESVTRETLASEETPEESSIEEELHPERKN